MAKTDRAFRALARASPRSVVSLIRLLRPELLRVEDAQIVALDDPQLDEPPHPKQADFAATVGEHEMLHVEGQGYRDPGFVDREFEYHLMFVLRHPTRMVRTVALWPRTPHPDQRIDRVERGSISIRVETIVLREVPASLLLSRPDTACFAAGADAGAMGEDELCDAVVAALGRADAPLQERSMAAVAAMTVGRYNCLMRAMERADMEPVIIEDLVDYGYALGRAEGHEAGREAGRAEGRDAGRLAEARAAVLSVLAERGFVVSESSASRVNTCTDVAQLELWLRRAVSAASAGEALA